SRMLSQVHVLSLHDYEEYLRIGPHCPDQYHEDWEWGQQLFTSNGCPACHNVNPAQGVLVGPNLANVAGTQQPLEGGRTLTADTEYLHRALHDPQSDTVRGFASASAMPNFSALPQSNVNALIAYLAHLSDHGQSVQVERQCGVQQ